MRKSCSELAGLVTAWGGGGGGLVSGRVGLVVDLDPDSVRSSEINHGLSLRIKRSKKIKVNPPPCRRTNHRGL